MSNGVYIKGMEMPDCCLDCPLYNGHGCKATLQMFHPITNVAVRVEGCPLIEVKTPHGRLIDNDYLVKCPKCGRSDYIRSFEDWGIDGGIYKYKCINCNTYIKDEPQTEREGE